jgi:hypothetical protein
MLTSTIKTLRSLGVPRSQIHTERFEL